MTLWPQMYFLKHTTIFAPGQVLAGGGGAKSLLFFFKYKIVFPNKNIVLYPQFELIEVDERAMMT